MPQNLSVNGFKWVEKISQLNKDFIESCNKEIDEGYFF